MVDNCPQRTIEPAEPRGEGITFHAISGCDCYTGCYTDGKQWLFRRSDRRMARDYCEREGS